MRYLFLIACVILVLLKLPRSSQDHPVALNNNALVEQPPTEMSTSISSEVSADTDEVYICKSGSAYAYHKKMKCRGLSNCSRAIEKVSKDDAVNEYGRRACKVCH